MVSLAKAAVQHRPTRFSAGARPAAQDVSLESVACALIVGGYLIARLEFSRVYLKLQESAALASLAGLDRKGALQRLFGDDQMRGTALSWKLAVAQR